MKLVVVFLLGALFGFGSVYFWINREDTVVINPITIIDRPLDAYTIENLSNRNFAESQVLLEDLIEETEHVKSYKFSYMVDGKRVTGLANVPRQIKPENGYPVIIQLRGFVPRDIYESGVGTKRSGFVYAENGFVTLAPDFLGYGESDYPSESIFEERFQTYTVAATLLASISSLDIIDSTKVGLWGHSNGGHIALTILEILKSSIPTTLWAPVTKPFPYSILFYTDEASDSGKFLRRHLAAFESLYDTDKYSLISHVDSLQGPMQLHQGSIDPYVPQKWSDEFVQLVGERGKSIEYFVYPGADHNLNTSGTNSWNIVVARDLEFFRKHLLSESLGE